MDPLESQFAYMIEKEFIMKAQHMTRGFLKYSREVGI
jgi:hypothetical protein